MLLLATVWGGLALVAAAWLGGTTASWATGHGWRGPAFGVQFAHALVTEGPGSSWPRVPGAAVTAGVVVAVGGVAGVTVAAVRAGRTNAARPFGLAGARDLAVLLTPASTTRAQALRPSLPGGASGAETGLALGVIAGTPARRRETTTVRASWEDVLLAVMAPRAGKTTSLAVPSVLDAPGAVVATSNKADLWAATAAVRARDTSEAVWTFDPQAITNSPRTWWWNPLTAVDSVEEASRLAGHFVQEVRAEKSARDFWSSAAQDLLTALLLAAATSRRSLHDVYEWLNDPVVPTPGVLLREHGYPAVAASLTGRQHGAPETRDGIYETARTAAQCLRDDRIMEWVTPPAGELPQLDTTAFATSRETLYLLSKDGAGAAGPLVAALTDRVMRDGVRAAERCGGRLDPPLVVVLDEAANVCRISDLPDLYSHLGSRGIVPLTILQSYRQGVRVWGEAGMDTLWSAATVKLLGAGIDDAKLAEDVSRLIGEHDVTIRSFSEGDRRRTTSTSLRRQRILPPEDVRALARGHALLLATGLRVGRLELLPYYQGSRAGDVAAATAEATAATVGGVSR
ncbi:type IV secretory system conjugative DNA transfer family protein [Kineococcus sp. R8]|nr:type IV secretory system conjugative DNA transfer family protein [Kineococcus siccus]